MKQEIINLIEKIESAEEFPKQESILCKWCEYKNLCKEFSIQEQQQKEKLLKEKFPTASKYIKKEFHNILE